MSQVDQRRAPASRTFRAFVALIVAVAALCSPTAAVGDLNDEIDLSTPRRAAASFIAAAQREDWATARDALEGSTTASPVRKKAMLEDARKLAYLLEHSITFDIDDISDAPDGKPEDGVDTETVTTLRMSDGQVPIVLRRVRVDPPRWAFSAGTVSRIPEIYAARGPSPIEAHVPAALKRDFLGAALWQWLGLLGAIFFGVIAGRLVAFVTTKIGTRIASRTRVPWDDELVLALRSPSRLFFSVIAFVPAMAFLALPGTLRLIAWRTGSVLFLAALAWSAIRIVGVVSNLVEGRALAAATGTNAALRTRGVQTQVRVLRRVVTLVLVVCSGAIMLMQFDVVRHVGVSLLASAGVAGIVLGLAAQRTLGSLFAGIQLSITQPIRMGDEVTIENEFGMIEEITLTYVVVRVWDERRLIVPMSRFLDFPFQNWTKMSTALHGTVVLQADWSTRVDAVREELARILEDHPRWDRRTKAVHVTEVKDRTTMELRVLVSAANAEDLFELRADVRERLMGWLSGREAKKAQAGDPRKGEPVSTNAP